MQIITLQLQAGLMTQEEYKDALEEMNQYSKGHHASWRSVVDLQTALLLELWDGRDALTGKKLVSENGDLLETVIRHHYEIIGYDGRDPIFMKFDCRLMAQVPLCVDSHGKVNVRQNAGTISTMFKEVMEKLMRGEWATPDWWSKIPGGNERLVSFERNLLRLGFIKPNNLNR
jgi:hypothetical protein